MKIKEYATVGIVLLSIGAAIVGANAQRACNVVEVNCSTTACQTISNEYGTVIQECKGTIKEGGSGATPNRYGTGTFCGKYSDGEGCHHPTNIPCGNSTVTDDCKTPTTPGE